MLKPPTFYPFNAAIPTKYPHSPSELPHGPRINLLLIIAAILRLLLTVTSTSDVSLPELVMSALDLQQFLKHPHIPPINQTYSTHLSSMPFHTTWWKIVGHPGIFPIDSFCPGGHSLVTCSLHYPYPVTIPTKPIGTNQHVKFFSAYNCPPSCNITSCLSHFPFHECHCSF